MPWPSTYVKCLSFIGLIVVFFERIPGVKAGVWAVVLDFLPSQERIVKSSKVTTHFLPIYYAYFNQLNKTLSGKAAPR